MDADAFHPAGRCPSADPVLQAAFAAAAESAAAAAADSVDGFLEIGSLDCGLCITYLSRAMGRPAGPDHVWEPEAVARLGSPAAWPDPDAVPADERWAYWSARRFAETCAAHGLGVSFS